MDIDVGNAVDRACRCSAPRDPVLPVLVTPFLKTASSVFPADVGGIAVRRGAPEAKTSTNTHEVAVSHEPEPLSVIGDMVSKVRSTRLFFSVSSADPAPTLMSTRRKARENVMKALYAREMGGGDTRHVVYTILEPALEEDAVTLEFGRKLLEQTVESKSEADAVISKHAKNWDIGRITPVDRILLRMAIIELLYMEDIPPKVTIDEALEIAKSYSTPKSSTFINGILDAALSDLTEQGRIQKSGRGLVGMDIAKGQEESSS